MSGKEQDKLTEFNRLVLEYGSAKFSRDIKKVSTMTVWRLRVCETGTTVTTARRIAKVLECKIEDLYPPEDGSVIISEKEKEIMELMSKEPVVKIDRMTGNRLQALGFIKHDGRSWTLTEDLYPKEEK